MVSNTGLRGHYRPRRHGKRLGARVLVGRRYNKIRSNAKNKDPFVMGYIESTHYLQNSVLAIIVRGQNFAISERGGGGGEGE